MNAIIMAGGEGTRLRPLTCDTPKPMVPVLGKPVMSYALQLLARHGLTEVGVTLQYLPEKISRHFDSGARQGVRLHYTRERTPLGTAGGVLQAAKGRYAPPETFVVLSGDGLTDCDLTDALRFHREKGALATMVLTRVRDPLAYGVVMADDDGRVRRFVEKPGWGEVYSDTVNTGIYLLEPEVLSYIFPDKPCDFGRDLFPALVREGKGVYAYVSDAYWCDIGDQAAYVRAQADFLQGKVRLDAGAFIAETAQIDDTAEITGPCYIGPGARILAHARLSDCAVIGMNAEVGPRAHVARSVVWEDAKLALGAQLRGAVICRGAQVLTGASALEETTLGDGAILGPRAALEAGAKVWPGKRIDPCMRVTENVVWEGAMRPSLSGGVARAADPQAAGLYAAAFAAATGAPSIALGHDGTLAGTSLYSAVSSAALAQGTRVYWIGECMLPTFRCAQRMTDTPAGVYAEDGQITMTTARGGVPDRALERKVEGLLARQDFARPFSRALETPVTVADADALYIGALSARIPTDAFASAKPHVALFVHSDAQKKLCERLLTAVSLPGRVEIGLGSINLWETGFALSRTGETVTAFDSQKQPDDAEQMMLIYAAMPEGPDWIAPIDATAMLEPLAKPGNRTVRRVSAAKEAWASALLAAGDASFDMHYDGLFRMLHICRLLAARGTTLTGLLARMPTSYRHMERIPIALPDRGRLLHAIAESERHASLAGGLRVTRETGWLTVNPDERAAEMVVVGESADMEAAKELCGEMIERIRKGNHTQT